MTTRMLLTGLMVTSLAGCSVQLGAPRPTMIEVREPAAPALPPVEKASERPLSAEPLLSTADFESGQCQINAVSGDRLEAFLRNLNRRKDHDYSMHDGQPGPDSAYLWQWVQNVVSELQARGYFFDDAGNLHRPDTIVAIR